jgi:hypothetical protein
VNPPPPDPSAVVGRELWLPILQQAIREVFELMLAYSLEVPTVPPADQGLDITAIVGRAS